MSFPGKAHRKATFAMRGTMLSGLLHVRRFGPLVPSGVTSPSLSGFNSACCLCNAASVSGKLSRTKAPIM